MGGYVQIDERVGVGRLSIIFLSKISSFEMFLVAEESTRIYSATDPWRYIMPVAWQCFARRAWTCRNTLSCNHSHELGCFVGLICLA